MATKRNPSIIPRFTGKTGRANLHAAICGQQSVAGNQGLARSLMRAGTLGEFKTNKLITKQGDSDNDIFLIIAGSVGIEVNCREVAVRQNGTHVGEMALLEPTARRSASIIAREKTVVFRISEQAVTRVAQQFPEFWRRLAIELATRLRERAKFIRPPNPVTTIFVGSSSEAIKEATYISRAFEKRNLSCRLWTEGVFQLSATTIEDLTRTAEECDFAALFLTPDDLTRSRGQKKSSPRDNVVFELGLFMGALGRDRTFVVVPSGVDIKLPTDLLGVTHCRYDGTSRRPIGQRLRQTVKALLQKIESLPPK